MTNRLSIKILKQELSERGVDFHGCNERHELEKLHQLSETVLQSDCQGSAETADDSVEDEMAGISNLLDTLPASLKLLKTEWSDRRSLKIGSQLKRVQELLSSTKKRAISTPSWNARLIEYNDLAKAYKQIRDTHV
jgi:hypothetical protein